MGPGLFLLVLGALLTFAVKDDLEVGRKHYELFVRVVPYRLAMLLPDSLKRREVAGARFADDRLEITFQERQP